MAPCDVTFGPNPDHGIRLLCARFNLRQPKSRKSAPGPNATSEYSIGSNRS